MTLIIAKIIDNSLFVVGDTKLSHPYIEKNHPLDGVIKTVFISETRAVSYAVDVESAREALLSIHDLTEKQDVIDQLSQVNKESDHGTEFILTEIISTGPEIWEFKNGKVEESQSSWIGNHKAFSKFQQYFNKPESIPQYDYRTTQFQVVGVPQVSSKKCTEEFSKVRAAVKAVIEDHSIEDVGGFVISLIGEDNKFHYPSFIELYRRPVDVSSIKPGEAQAIDFGDATDGGFSVNFIGGTSPKTAIYMHQGELGVLFGPSNDGIAKPILHKADEIDFFEYLKQSHSLKASFTMKHEFENYSIKGSKELEQDNLEKALHLFNQAVEKSSCEWGTRRNTENKFNGFSQFRELKGEPVIQEKDKNNLALTFWYRGQTNKTLKKFDDALCDFLDSSELSEFTGFQLGELMIVQIELRKFEDALVTSDKLESKLKHETVYHNRGVILFNLNRIPEAIIEYRKALEINPKFTLSARALFEIGKLN
jgi:tetratricopeptide (TPR) repeat protein